MLVLPIKKKWFDMILSGEKLEEYRGLTPYYKVRFENVFEMFPCSCIPTGLDVHDIIIRNGYSSTSPSAIISCTLDIGRGKVEWGAALDEDYYVLKIRAVSPLAA